MVAKCHVCVCVCVPAPCLTWEVRHQIDVSLKKLIYGLISKQKFWDLNVLHIKYLLFE